MLAEDAEPEGDGLALPVVLRGEVDGDLGDREQRVDQVAGDLLRRFGRVPHQHVGVDRDGPGGEAHVDRPLPVLLRAERAVGGADHGDVRPQARADVRLAVLDHRLRVGCGDPAADRGEQPFDALVDARAVRLGGDLRGIGPGEPVDEVDLEAVHAPLLDGAGEPVGEEGPDLGVARVGDDRAHVAGVGERVTADPLVRGAVLADERQRVPEQVAHSEFVDASHVGGGVGQRDRLPVAAVGVAAGAVGGHPAVVHDDDVHAELLAEGGLGLDALRRDVLVHRVPGGVGGAAGGLGDVDGAAGGRVAGAPPVGEFGQAAGEVPARGVDADGEPVGGLGPEPELAGLLDHSGSGQHVRAPGGEGAQRDVPGADEGGDRCAVGEAGTARGAPGGGQPAGAARLWRPEGGGVGAGHPPFDPHLARAARAFGGHLDHAVGEFPGRAGAAHPQVQPPGVERAQSAGGRGVRLPDVGRGAGHGPGRGPGRALGHAHPFVAPASRPEMNCRWRTRKRTIIGRVDSAVPERIAP